MSLQTFAPSPGPSFTVPLAWDWLVSETRGIKPYVQTIPKFELPVRRYSLSWRVTTAKLRDYLVAFFHRTNGPGREFLWTPPDPVWAPEDAGPDLDQVSGGALAQRTYHARYTWFETSSGKETTPSPSSSITVQANYLLTVAVPRYPSGVGAWRIYVGTSAGDERLQGYASSRLWTESAGGIVPDAAPPPNANTLSIPTKWRLVGGVQERKLTANRFALEITLEEFFG